MPVPTTETSGSSFIPSITPWTFSKTSFLPTALSVPSSNLRRGWRAKGAASKSARGECYRQQLLCNTPASRAATQAPRGSRKHCVPTLWQKAVLHRTDKTYPCKRLTVCKIHFDLGKAPEVWLPPTKEATREAVSDMPWFLMSFGAGVAELPLLTSELCHRSCNQQLIKNELHEMQPQPCEGDTERTDCAGSSKVIPTVGGRWGLGKAAGDAVLRSRGTPFSFPWRGGRAFEVTPEAGLSPALDLCWRLPPAVLGSLVLPLGTPGWLDMTIAAGQTLDPACHSDAQVGMSSQALKVSVCACAAGYYRLDVRLGLGFIAALLSGCL